MTGEKASPASIGRAERDGRILELRKSGLTEAQIAEQVSLSQGRVSQILHRELEAAQLQRGADAAELLELEAGRLDSLMSAIWDKCTSGDLRAIDRCLRIVELRCKLLGVGAFGPEENWMEAAQLLQGILLKFFRVIEDDAVALQLSRIVEEAAGIRGAAEVRAIGAVEG